MPVICHCPIVARNCLIKNLKNIKLFTLRRFRENCLLGFLRNAIEDGELGPWQITRSKVICHARDTARVDLHIDADFIEIAPTLGASCRFTSSNKYECKEYMLVYLQFVFQRFKLSSTWCGFFLSLSMHVACPRHVLGTRNARRKNLIMPRHEIHYL